MENVNVIENAFGYLEQTTIHRFTGFFSELKERPWFYEKIEQLSPITLFAPTDKAWSALPQYFWNSPELIQERSEMILYHTVPRTILFKSISYGQYSNFSTLLPGNDMMLKRNASGIFIKSNVESKIVGQVMIRGVMVYAIDTVLEVPPRLPRFVEGIMDGNHTFSDSLYYRNGTGSVFDGLNSAFNSSEGFTLLLPSKNAVSQFPVCRNGTRPSKESITKLLLNHVIPQKLYSIHFRGLDNVTTLGNLTLIPSYANGTTYLFPRNDDTFQVNATLLETDLLVSNGVVHTIDEVLPLKDIIECIAI